MALGVSPAMISKLKARGMPVHSVAAAAEWRRQNLDPALVKEIRRPAALAQTTAAPGPLAIVRKLADLAAVDPGPWLAELRLALREVPRELRDGVELTIETWDALLAELWLVLERDQVLAPPAHDGPEDDAYVGVVLYEVACGERRVVVDSAPGDDAGERDRRR